MIGNSRIDFAGAYAVTRNFGLTLKGSFNPRTNSQDYNQKVYGDFGLGYTNTIPANDRFFYSIFGGAGIGSANGRSTYQQVLVLGNSAPDEIIETASGNYGKAFIQPSIGWKTPHVELILAPRVTYVSFSNLERARFQDGVGGAVTGGNHFNYIYEPTFTVRAGGERVKAMAQFGVAIPHNDLTITAFRNRELIMVLGMQFSLGGY